MFIETRLSRISYPRHPVNKKEIIGIINENFIKIRDQLNRPFLLHEISHKDLNPDRSVFASTDDNKVTFYINNICKIISIFETKNARKAWLLILIVHEVYHNIASIDRLNFDNKFLYENHINTLTIQWIRINYPCLELWLKMEWERMNKSDINGIWYTLSFSMINEWKEER